MADYFLSSASGAGGAGTGASWANAYLTMAACIARPIVAGDRIWLGDDHAESTAAAVTLTFPGTIASPNFVYCVDHTIASPTVADLKLGTATAGKIQTTGASASNVTINGVTYFYGVYFLIGSVNVSLTLGGLSGAVQVWDNCTFAFNGTVGQTFQLGGASSAGYAVNCTLKFTLTAAAGSIINGRGIAHWKGGSIDTSVAVPFNLFSGSSTSRFLMEDVDLTAFAAKTLVSAIGSGASLFYLTFKRCKLGASTVLVTPSVQSIMANSSIDLIQCDSAAGYYRNEHYNGSGSQTTVTNVVRTKGAIDSGTAIAWKILTTANNRWSMPFWAPQIVIWNTVTGSNVNATVEGIADPRDFSALPLNDEVWFEAEYFAAANTLGSIVPGTKANNLATGTALTASAPAWDSAATARINSTAYALGAIVKVASNSGRLFVCTTAGTSASSEPAGYASAVDGGSVTDNTATFKAMWRFRQTILLPAPGAAGYVYVTPKFGKTSIAGGVYLDPLITLS